MGFIENVIGIVQFNKPGTAQVGTMPKAQKKHQDLKMSSILFCGTRKTQKLDRTGAPGPASEGRWCAKRGILWYFYHSFCCKVSKKIEGGMEGRLLNFRDIKKLEINLIMPKKTD